MVSRARADLDDGHLKLGQRKVALKIARAVIGNGGIPGGTRSPSPSP
jgi:hypothetical protein